MSDEKGKVEALYIPVELREQIEEYRRGLKEIPNFSEAVRRLIEAGLEARGYPRK